jgi:hypothetical protein
VAKAPLELRSLARTHTAMAVRTLALVARSPKAPPSARVAAAEALLSRGWGKPVQPVDTRADTELKITIRHIMGEMGMDPKLIEGDCADLGDRPAA